MGVADRIAVQDLGVPIVVTPPIMQRVPMRSLPTNRPAPRGGLTLMLAGLLMLAAACSGGEAPETADQVAAAPMAADAGDAAPAEAASEHVHAAEGEGEALLPIMQSLGTYMTSLTHGLMTEDPAMVATNAASIASHPPVAAEEVERIHGVLGTEMAEFERLDEEVHVASEKLHEAALAGGTDDVLMRLNEVQRGCVACHTKFRERLRTNPAP